MSSSNDTFLIPKYECIPKCEHSSVLKVVLQVCQKLQEQQNVQTQQLKLQSQRRELQRETLELQREQLGLQSEQIRLLKDEILILKKEKPRPKIKPSKLNQNNQDKPKGGGSNNKKGKRGKPVRKKTKSLEIHEEVIIHPENIPPGSVFKGYEDYVVQDIEIKPKNTKFRRARYNTPEGEHLVGKLPAEIKGSHFAPNLKSFILSQYYQQHVTQPLILKQLREFGIEISAGQLGRIIIERHEEFHEEKDSILQVGLEVSSYVNVDDTGARHKGKNGVCTHIGNEFFAWFSSTGSKSRINFLELLCAGRKNYVVDAVARQYMAQQKLPKASLSLFADDTVFSDKTSWKDYLKALGVNKERHIRIATEGVLVANIVSHGVFPELVIVSDDAGQFNVVGFLNALCWVHAERTINKIIPFTDSNREVLKEVQGEIWDFYQKLKIYKETPSTPSQSHRLELGQEFDKIFTQKTIFQTLNLALTRIHNNKKELLLVLERPEIPLHNNLSENDIRDYVKKRKISATTRSDEGRKARDTFLSLKKTCYKLKVSFSEYLLDRISQQNKIQPLPQLIIKAAQAP